MATPSEKLASALAALQELQKDGRRVFQSKELSRLHRERLLRGGFLQSVMKGWLISSSPGAGGLDSTPWYASFWEFCAHYCEERFGDRWHLSPEQSLLLRAENTAIPAQVVIYSLAGTNNAIPLPFGTSLYDLRQSRLPPPADMIVRDGLRLYAPAIALMKVPEAFFARYPIESRVVLSSLPDISDLSRRLLDGGHSAVAGRLAGALRRVGRADAADEIAATMTAAGYEVREVDPFASGRTFGKLQPAQAPIVARIEAIWQSMREHVLRVFPKPPGLPQRKASYLRLVEGKYQSDAYHSLSIEGYRVTPQLIERVRSGGWNPLRHEEHRQDRDALAARGYWQAFQVVKANVGDIIAGGNPGEVVRTAHREWYRELFQPLAATGLIEPTVLAGYRNGPVYLRTSRYIPPRWEAVRDAMDALFDLLGDEPEPAVRAVLGHWLFGYIHPYPDGNGRIARFLMNAMLASGGYPWTIVRMEDRDEYLSALDRASLDMDIGPFARFAARRVRSSSRNGPTAPEQRRRVRPPSRRR
jgi:fido (protein-threonine AMPylation protein)